VAAACAEGRTILRGAQALQADEADCVRLMADGLLALGIEAEPVLDGIIIEGGVPDGGDVDARGYQRIVMAFKVASLR
ncbi:prephenate dehydrogenase/arogenate dehydrogenase family protein, partial [Pseudomonas syringae pv. tagetis]